MKAAVVYDSVFGNTKLIAEAIAEQLREEGLEVELFNLREEKTKQIEADIMFLGGPTRMKHLTRKVRGFIKKLDEDYWGTRTIVVFDTYGPLPKSEEERQRQERWINPGAVGEMRTLAASRGLRVHAQALRSPVVGLKGPLDPQAESKAREFAHEIVASLGK